MIAVGSEYRELAAIARPRAEDALGYPIELITESHKPFEIKLDLLARSSGDRVVVLVDADAVLSSFDWAPVKFGCINARRVPYLSTEREHVELLGTSPMLHTGLVVAHGRAAAEAASLAVLLMRENKRPLSCQDELPLSVACRQINAPVNLLPDDAVTCITGRADKRVTCAHFIGGSPANKLRRVNEYVEKFL